MIIIQQVQPIHQGKLDMQKIKLQSCSRPFNMTLTIGIALLFAASLSPGITLAGSIDPPKFHQGLYQLHLRVIKDKQLRLVETEGKYQGSAAGEYRYRDTQYYDATSGRLLSHVIRDANSPEAIHIVEVNIYDDSGRIVRDFGSITLPASPAHPVRTFINFHQYNKDLHSFRQFDADGEVTYESCKGYYENRKVNISLDGLDIKPAETAKAEYKACFNGIESAWTAYAIPH